MKRTRILAIDDDPAMLSLARFELQERGYDITAAKSAGEALELLQSQSFDLALTDLQLPDLSGIELVKRIKGSALDTEIIMITGYGSTSQAVEAIRAGAFYFVEKPLDFTELQMLIEKALERRGQAIEISQLRRQLAKRSSYYNLIGHSRPMQHIYEIIESVAESDANVLIVGESGTGKELVAAAIHYRSLRAKQAFVQVNCAALPKELIESELFGHTKGAFTGAQTDKGGLIAQAAGGSLLLDEIGEMPLELQPKLLRILQERVYYRIGSEKPKEANFRLITSTNRNPLEAVRAGHLREDLYYRINTIEILVPPLRDRLEDIQTLAEHFLRVFSEKYQRKIHAISEQTYQRLLDYDWPGNVRQLQNAIERAVLMCKGEILEINPTALGQPNSVRASAPVVESPLSVVTTDPPPSPDRSRFAARSSDHETTIEGLCKQIVTQIPVPKTGEPLRELFKELEVYLAKAALERTHGNKQAAAKLLGIYRPRLYHLLKQAGTREENTSEGNGFAARA